MLSDRKRFNYMVNTSGYHSSSQKKPFPSVVRPVTTVFHEECNKHQQDKENQKIQELEQVNKKLIEETAKQFKKLESDVQRVQKILEEKENQLEQSKKDNQKLEEEVYKIGDEKKILIEAIFEKDMVIKEYQLKLKELLENNQPTTTPLKVKEIETNATVVQTDDMPESIPKTEYDQTLQTNLEMEDEIYRLKEQLFDSNNKVKLLTQEFEAYKILKEIETVQEN